MGERYWFAAKDSGLGWIPATWEGWTVFAIFLIGMFIWPLVVSPRNNMRGFLFGVGGFSVVFIAVAWATGEPQG